MIRALKGGKRKKKEEEKKEGEKKEKRAKRICQILQCQVINHKCCEATRIQTPGPRACTRPTFSASCPGGHRDFSSPRATITLVPSSEAVTQHCRDSYRQPWQTSQEFHNHIPRRLRDPRRRCRCVEGRVYSAPLNSLHLKSIWLMFYETATYKTVGINCVMSDSHHLTSRND